MKVRAADSAGHRKPGGDTVRGDSGAALGPLALFCTKLKHLQQAAGVTQTSLARAADVSTSQMSDIQEVKGYSPVTSGLAFLPMIGCILKKDPMRHWVPWRAVRIPLAAGSRTAAASQKAIEDVGLSFILGARIPDVPYVVARWRREHPGREIPDGQTFTPPRPPQPRGQPPRLGHLLPVQGRPGAAGSARHRRAGRQGRESRRRGHAGQAEPVRPAARRDP